MGTVLYWQNIQGLIIDGEVAFLQYVCEDKDVLEIGAYHGKSTSAIAMVAKSLCTVDMFQYSVEWPGGDKLIKEDFDKNTNCFDNLTVFVGDSTVKLPRLITCGVKFDVIFIDGGHDRNIFLNDFYNSLFLTRDENSLIVCHDYEHKEFPDIKQIVDFFVPVIEYRIYSTVGFRRKNVRV